MWKSRFQPAFGLPSTQTLVKLYNRYRRAFLVVSQILTNVLINFDLKEDWFLLLLHQMIVKKLSSKEMGFLNPKPPLPSESGSAV